MRGTLVQFQNLIAIVKISKVLMPTPRGRRDEDNATCAPTFCECYIKEIP
jgi:hypothetical protein